MLLMQPALQQFRAGRGPAGSAVAAWPCAQCTSCPAVPARKPCSCSHTCRLATCDVHQLLSSTERNMASSREHCVLSLCPQRSNFEKYSVKAEAKVRALQVRPRTTERVPP